MKNRLNFGCGNDIKKGYINADKIQIKGVDKAFDFDKFPYPFKSNTFDEIFANNVLEHLNDILMTMKELHRISKQNGIIRIIVPYYNCYGAYNDVTHKHYFSHLSFDPFYNKKNRLRKSYGISENYKLLKLKFIPTRIGKLLMFDIILIPLSFIFGQLIQVIDIKLQIIKK